MVQIVGASMQKRKTTGVKVPLVGVRTLENLKRLYIYRQVDILGPSSIMELDAPIPGTDGRVICPLITDAPLRVYRDDKAA